MLIHRSSALAAMAMVAAPATGTDDAADALLLIEMVQQAPQRVVSGRPCMLCLLSRYVSPLGLGTMLEFRNHRVSTKTEQ